MPLTVAKLAGSADISTDTVRYYEKIGLLKEAPRNSSGYRVYDDSAVERLRFVRGGQRLGLKLAEIRELLEIRDDGLCPCGHADDLLAQRIAGLDEEIAQLSAMRDELQAIAESRADDGDCVQTFVRLEKKAKISP